MTTDITITCPKCGAGIPLTEAVSHRLREQMGAEFDKERQTLNAVLAERETKLAAERSALQRRQKALQEEVNRQVEAERLKLRADATRQAEEKLGMELRDLQAQVAGQRTKLKAAQDAELALRNEQRELEEAKSNLELEVARKLDAERRKIAAEASQRATEAERLKLADKEKIISDLQREIQNLKQKAEQGSMQLQGESFELTLEAELSEAFRYDDVVEVKKGERGADINQRVRTNAGLDCGSILWEAKRAKNWSSQWPEKLREDQSAAGAELAVIVTTCPPPEVRGMGPLDGVWVCEPSLATPLAAALRQGLISTANQRLQDTDRSSKMAALYDHLCSTGFRQHIQAVVESFLALQEQLAAEQRALTKQWKEREKQLQRAIQHLAELYGGIQGIAGREALPEIAPLQLTAATTGPEPESANA